MKKIKAIILDYGGVISNDQDSGIVKTMTDMLSVDTATYRRLYVKYRQEYDTNNISAEEYWQKIINNIKAPIDNQIIKDLIELDVKSWTKINKNSLEYIKTLYKCGFKLAILSNITTDTLKYVKRNFNWLELFNFLIFSCEIRLAKPDAEIYFLCLKKLKLRADECLFVDDSIENIKEAQKCGLNTLLFTSTNQLISDINDRFVKEI